MSTSEERAAMSKDVDAIIPMACNGNKLAERYLHDIAWANRVIDDIYDEDVPVSKNDKENLFKIILLDIPTNPFYLQNFHILIAQHAVIYNAWMDANRWEKDEAETKRICAHFIKEYVCELIPLVAFLTGGTMLMRKISLMSREMFLNELPVKAEVK